MKKWMRWKGLMVFAAALVVIVLVWMLLVDTVVRRTIEAMGTRAVGARVDLAKADLTLFPAGLSLNGLAVTNPDAPMQNVVEIAHMKMDLEAGYLIRRKLIINELVVEGLRFSTKRRRSGAVPALAAEKQSKRDKKAEPEKGSGETVKKLCGEFSMPSLSQPDVGAILAKESLASVALANDLEAKLTAARAQWEKQLKQLPDEKKLRAYQAQVEKLTKGGGSLSDILASAGKAQKLQADIENDLNLLKKAHNTFTTDFKAYQQQVNDLAKAPAKDIERLMSKYSLSPKGLANLSRMIFGDQICGWIQTATKWYRKVEPYVAKASKKEEGAPEARKPLRGKGQNIRFAEIPPMPDFLIRHIKLNAALDAGNLTGKAENVTSDQHVLGRPLTFSFLGREMKQIKALNLDGSADRVTPGSPKNRVRLAVKGLTLQNLALVQEASFPLTLQKAAGDLNLDLKTAGNILDAVLKADFSAVEFVSTAGEASSAMAGVMRSALGGVKRFSLKADITGTPEDYTVDVSSDLDQALKSAVGHLVKAEAAKLSSELNQQIGAQLKGPLTQTRSAMADLGGIETELGKRLNIGNDLLKDVKLF